MYQAKQLEGIGGWLAFFLVTLGVITPISVLVTTGITTTSTDVDPGFLSVWPRVVVMEWILAGITALACWFALYRFLRVRTWQTVRIGIAVLVLITAIAIFVEPLLAAALLGVSFGQIFQATGSELVRPIIYCGIWTAYLLRSDRVANTYRLAPLERDAEALSEVFE
jgi:hypothetical protein